MNELKIWFSLVKLPNKIKVDLINRYYNIENIWNKAINNKFFVNEEIRNRLIKAYDKDKIKSIHTELNRIGGKIIASYDDEYPKALLQIIDYPVVLYYKGNIKKLNENTSVAIVGSRKCTNYGEEITRIIVESLCENNINVISGMAAGIDSIAQKTAVEHNGYTAAVLGTGIDTIYPRKNIHLYNKICESGCVISEFPLGMKPLKYNFPIRNRIISGLSKLVIITEAGKKSGTMITANLALEQGKDVMAIPGQVFSETSKGTNALIKEGAEPFTCIDDIYQFIGKDNYKKISKIVNLESKYKRLYEVITNSPIHFDDILRITDIDITMLYELLFELQFKNIIKCINGNYYVRINEKI